MVICPYDKTHVIRKKRLSRHLIKCARNNKTVTRNFSSCEFNHSHKIKRGDGSDHYKYCEDKRRFDAWLERDLTCSKKGNTSLPKYEDVNISDGENWDEELEPFYSKNFLGLVSDIKKTVITFVWKRGTLLSQLIMKLKYPPGKTGMRSSCSDFDLFFALELSDLGNLLRLSL